MTHIIDKFQVEQDLFYKQVARGQQILTTATGTVNLLITSPMVTIFEGTATGQIVELPQANLLSNVGWTYRIYNTTPVAIQLSDFDSTSLIQLEPGHAAFAHLKRNATTAGEWEVVKLPTQDTDELVGAIPILMSYGANAGTGRVLNYVPTENSEDAPYIVPVAAKIGGAVLGLAAAVTGPDKTVAIFEEGDLINPIYEMTVVAGELEKIELNLNITVAQLDRLSVRVTGGSIQKPYFTFYLIG